MQNKNKVRNLIFPIIAVFILSFGFAIVPIFFSKSVFGFGYDGYGYNCDDQYGYGYICSDNGNDSGHKGGLIWGKFKHYRERYDKSESRRAYFKLKYLKRSKNPVLNAMFWEMRNIYLVHKFDSKEVFAKLNPAIQEKFRLFKEYHGNKKYREYKDKVY